MCSRHISLPFNFFCYTDDSSDLLPEVRVIPFVDNGLDHVVFNKLFLFSREFAQHLTYDRCVYFDLDIAIKQNINDVVAYGDGSLHVIPAVWRTIRKNQAGPPDYMHDINSSMMTWNTSENHQIWDHFYKDPDHYMLRYRWGMDPYLYYEHNIRGNLPRDKFYSMVYGFDEALMLELEPSGHMNLAKYTHITDPIPIVLLNGPAEEKHYQYVEQYRQL